MGVSLEVEGFKLIPRLGEKSIDPRVDLTLSANTRLTLLQAIESYGSCGALRY